MKAAFKRLMTVALLAAPIAINAALISTAGGLGVYDSADNVRWTSSGNLFALQYAGIPNLVNKIVTDVNSLDGGAGLAVVSEGYFTVSISDFTSTGAESGQLI